MSSSSSDAGRLPDFLIIGAARAGTTAIYSYLRQNPSIFMPSSKEPNFFAFDPEDLHFAGPGADYVNNSVSSHADYLALFQDAPAGAVCGEASPLYLYSEIAPQRIKALVPSVRMVAVLRNPIDQAFSHYLYAQKQRIEPLDDFQAALQAERERLAAGWQPLCGYSSFPRYAEQLERYYAEFDRDQILVRTYEDFLTAPEKLLSDITSFIGADTSFAPDLSYKPNAGGVPKNRMFQDFLMKPNPITGAIAKVVPQDLRLRIRDHLSSFNLKREDAMPPNARAILRERLLPEIDRLETLIDRDLSDWRA